MAQSATAQVKAGPALETALQKALRSRQDIGERVARTREKTDKLAELGQQLEEAITRRDVDAAALIGADYQTARATFDADRRDLATTMYAMTEGIKDIGAALEEVQHFTTDEQRIIDNADTMVRNAETAIASADAALKLAEAKTWFRQRAISAAEAQKALAESRLESARAAVEPAKQEAARRKRVRLESMELEASLQMLQTLTSQAAQIMKDNIGEIESDLETMVAGGRELNERLELLSQEVTERDTDLVRVGGELASLREQQGELQKNGPDWIAKQTEIDEKVREQADIETKRNQAFALFQDSQRFVEAYRAQEMAQRHGLEFTQMWIVLLETGVEHRIGIFDSALGISRTAANMEAAGVIDAVAVEEDERLASQAVRYTAAAAKQMKDRLHRTEDDMARMRDITSAGATVRAQWEEDMQGLLTKLRDNFGADPFYADREHHGSQA